MSSIYLKKYKLNKLQKIKQSNNYMYLFRYHDLNMNEINILKKKLKTLKYSLLNLKQNLIKKDFNQINVQGSLLLIYGNNNINIIHKMSTFKKIELIFLKINSNIYSFLKLKRVLLNINNVSLNISLVRPFLNFLFILKTIKKADIT